MPAACRLLVLEPVDWTKFEDVFGVIVDDCEVFNDTDADEEGLFDTVAELLAAVELEAATGTVLRRGSEGVTLTIAVEAEEV